MSPLRSVGARLGLALFVVLAGALAIVYLIVVPSLRTRLVDNKLDQLQRSTPGLLGTAAKTGRFGMEDFVSRAQDTVGARVVVFDNLTPDTLRTRYDSRSERSAADVDNDPIARKAAITGKVARGTVDRRGRRYAEVATPTRDLPQPGILLLSASLDDAFGSVHFVQRRLLLAGLLALAVSLAVGYAAARMFARRIRRLERAAERIAAGDFSQPVVDPRADELAQLAAAFDRMRLRLAQLDHARREFIANASHELRTPLFSLGGFLELLDDEELDATTRREFLDEMRAQLDRLTKLATELLDLSRLDAGRIRVERERLDLSELAHAVAAEFRPLATAQDRRLEVITAGPVPVWGDEQRVLQIGRVLIENALVHTPAGTPVSVRVAARGGRAALAVEDEGPGIPPEHARHIFERFYRVDGAVASGSGLGLAIARELAHLMDGELELSSGAGRTEFALQLPTAPDRAADSTRKQDLPGVVGAESA